MSGKSEYKYWAFISYSHRDETWGVWLHRALEGFRVPRALVGREGPAGKIPRRLVPVFRDRDELPGAADLNEYISGALAQSRFLIVICSPHSAVSRHVNEEIRAFRRLGRSDRILCLLVDGEPGASEHPESGLLEAFPEAVRFDLDGYAVEPLAADARPGKDGKTNAKVKLLAGLLGVGFDDLRRRETRRRRWRFVQLTVLAATLASLVVGVWWSRGQEVRRQELIAEARRVAAESLGIPEKESRRRIELALKSVTLTRDVIGHVLPEAEIALYRALTQSALRGDFTDSEDEQGFGGWTWPVAIDDAGDRIVAPSALGPTVILDGRADRVATLHDGEQPYEHDYAATFSADGRSVITGGADGFVRYWTRQGELIGRLHAHGSDVLVVEQSPDGERLLTVGCDDGSYQACAAGSARLWDRTGAQLATFAHPGARVIGAALSPDASRVLTVDDLGTMGLWHAGGAAIFRKADAGYWVSRASFSADGSRFVAGGCHPFVHAGMFSPVPKGYRLCPGYYGETKAEGQIVDDGGRTLQKLPGSFAAFDSLGMRFVTAVESCDERTATCRGRVQIWQTDGAPVTAFEVGPGIVDLRFSPDGQFLAVADEGGTITIADTTGRVSPYALGTTLGGLTSIRFSGDGARLVSVSCPNGHQGACLRRAIHVWDPNGSLVSNRVVSRVSRSPGQFDLPRPLIRFGSSSPILLVAANDGTEPMLSNLGIDRMGTLPAHDGVLHDASFGAGDTRLLTRGALGELWDVSGEAPVRLEAARVDTAMRGATGTSSRGILAADAGGVVREWDWNGMATGGHDIGSGDITAFETNAADDVIATVHEDGRVRLWDAAWTRIAEIDAGVLNQAPEDGWIARRYDTGFRARFSTDGKTILITGPKNLSAWDRQGRLRWNVDIDPLDESELLVTADRVLTVVCTERGRGASLGGLVSCYDSRVSLWDLDGAPIGRLNPGGERENLVAAVRFNARGNRIATLDEDGVTRLWDAQGNLIEPLPGLALALDFDATQGRLATLSPAGVVQLWQVWDDLQAMIDEAADRLQ